MAEDSGYLVAVTTTITPELELEGHSREVVRRVQQLRKDAGLDISDRIVLYLQDTPLLRRVFDVHGDYITGEVLAPETVWSEVSAMPKDRTSFALNDSEVTVALAKRGA